MVLSPDYSELNIEFEILTPRCPEAFRHRFERSRDGCGAVPAPTGMATGGLTHLLARLPGSCKWWGVGYCIFGGILLELISAAYPM